jgi:hypothetical protein
MGGTLRIVRTPGGRTSQVAGDGFHGLAKVRVASSNLVIRSKVTPRFRSARSTILLYHCFRDALLRGLGMPWEDVLWEQNELSSG